MKSRAVLFGSVWTGGKSKVNRGCQVRGRLLDDAGVGRGGGGGWELKRKLWGIGLYFVWKSEIWQEQVRLHLTARNGRE